ncbi:hypothetical protein CUJ84_Chr002483 [Rhizobium leguminosarum]|uniref:Uncharacterized protein n=1 Tax=Rhizobium leguminosarum TaxID=384 RepID=A0A2K9Z3N8_RHILE|nr:hypothetical protein CUJ84_Chr002483 [Rhizobium leguminosarum]
MRVCIASFYNAVVSRILSARKVELFGPDIYCLISAI